ncbi:MAG: type II toxin-antitoxin system VapC family toxin [Egibacteraceae bacterium]
MITDTGPLIAALDRSDPRHGLAVRILHRAGTNAYVPDPVAVEVDILARRWFGPHAGRVFLQTLRTGRHTRLTLTETLWRRAIEIDQQYADLNLGLVDTAVMAVAEQRNEPVFTFDLRDFRAVKGPDNGAWPLVVTEADLS